MELLFLSVWHLEDNWKPPKSEISFQLLLLLGSQRTAELKGIIEILLSHLHFVDENPRFMEVGWISLILEPFSDRAGTRDRVSCCPSPVAGPVLCVTSPCLTFSNKFWSFNQSGYCHLEGTKHQNNVAEGWAYICEFTQSRVHFSALRMQKLDCAQATRDSWI